MIPIKAKVYKMKRFKVLRVILILLFLPINIPLMLLYKLGELSEIILDRVENLYYFLLGKTVKILKWEDKIK